MLERFHVSEKDAIKINHTLMYKVTKEIFLKMGLSEEDADLSTDVLIYADLNGVDTHGVSNMLRSYVRMYQQKKTNPRPNIKIVKESISTAALDGDKGLGLHTAPYAMKLAINKAKEAGVGTRTTLNILDAEKELTQSESNLVNAQYQLIISSFELLKLCGLLNFNYLNF